MKNSSSAIKEEFIKEVNNLLIDTISVSSLCEKLQIKRQTFYYHYKDIYELTESILVDFSNDLFTDISSSYYLTQVLELLKDNFVFFCEIVRANLKDLVIKFLSNLLSPVLLDRINKVDTSHLLSNKEKLDIVNYHTIALANLACNELNLNNEFNISTVLNKIEVFINVQIINANVNYINSNRSKL